eukprot:GFKZ01007855.1.p1 GENE.GFKZ01007855.1~~GFKZ01007855.1.p1  ORF type:complete len:489 (+),score=55.14 GFKZ01007855.1:450-1916(+)
MTAEEIPDFITLVDAQGFTYLSANLETVKAGLRPENASEMAADIATFLSDTLVVTPRVANRFSSDLTSADDPLLALLSLLLLLVMESILATILLRTYRGAVSNVGFSIKQFIDMAREFRFTHLFKGYGKRSSDPRRRINRNVLFVALTLLILTFGLEGAILFLSSPELNAVFNDKTSYTLRTDILPDWNEIQRAGISATMRPCSAITLADVDQGNNQLSLCMMSDRLTNLREEPMRIVGNTTLSIESEVHQFGVQHRVTVADLTARFIGRGYFTLDDAINRMLRSRESLMNRDNTFGLLHRQYVAYLFSQHAKIANIAVSVELLDALDFNFNATNGETIRVIQSRGNSRFRRAPTRRYTTVVTGMIPQGDEALRFAHATLKGSIAVALGGPDETDLHMGRGDIVALRGWLWRETTRKLNWLSLTILLAFSAATLIFMRYLFAPVGTAEIAGTYVTEVVGAEVRRPPALLQGSERMHFRAPREVISVQP